MDEPLGALDPVTRDSLQDEFTNIHQELGLTTLMVTHDMTEALLMADRIAVMNEGRIARLGTPHDLLTDPRDEYAKKLMEMPKRQADRVSQLVGQKERLEDSEDCRCAGCGAPNPSAAQYCRQCGEKLESP